MISQDIRIPRWMRLALPDDCAQIVKIAEYLIPQSKTRQDFIDYSLKVLRHEIWDRQPTKRPKVPSSLRPSKILHISGYRTNHSIKNIK